MEHRCSIGHGASTRRPLVAELPVWVVAAAAAPGVVALVLCVFLWRGLARAREANRVLLPDGAKTSLADGQAALRRGVEQLDRGLAALETLVADGSTRTAADLLTALRFQGLVRYNAYRDMGGQQSWSLALLDGNSTGAVVTSLHARDHARVYLKEFSEGRPAQRLSPEEQRAFTLATGREPLPMEDTPPADAAEGMDEPNATSRESE